MFSLWGEWYLFETSLIKNLNFFVGKGSIILSCLYVLSTISTNEVCHPDGRISNSD